MIIYSCDNMSASHHQFEFVTVAVWKTVAEKHGHQVSPVLTCNFKVERSVPRKISVINTQRNV